MIELTQHRSNCKCEECYECLRCEDLQELLDYAIGEMELYSDETMETTNFFDIRDLVKRLKGAV